MDERLARIFKLVFLLNQKGKDLQLNLGEVAIYILNADCKNIIPHWTEAIYFDKYWKTDYDEMVKGTLELLETMLEEEM